MFTDPFQALTYLKTHPVDLLFLDIQMPDISGIRFFHGLEKKPAVIFTTAHPQYAVQGFDLEAIDYLVKPIKFERFMKAVRKADHILFPPDSPSVSEEEASLFVKSGYESVRIRLKDIAYIEALDDYSKFILTGSEKPQVLTLMTLKAISEKLPSGRFMRVHRSYIVPLSKITSVRGKSIRVGNNRIPLGETYADEIHAWMKGGKRDT
ncbi:MAG: response regulator transcription factor [Bacteroidales bacterium]|nr:response regulator transcription factor [Bacteroidales bacterium]